MNDIINKSYKRKNSENSDTFIVESIENDFIIFSNGARCKINTLVTDFEEINYNDFQTEPELSLNPDTFFDSKITENNPLLEQLDNVIINKTEISSNRLQDSIDLDTKFNSAPPSQANSLADRMSNSVQTPETKLHINDSPESPQIAPKSENRLPEWDVFDRVKRSTEIEVLIPIKIKLPHAQKIDALDDMFDSSFIMYLAKQYINDNIKNNTLPIQKLIQETIENWVEEEVYGKTKSVTTTKPKPKTTRTTKTKSTRTTKPKTTRTPAKKKVVKEKVEAETSVVPAGDINLFGTQPTWDGNINKLMLINTNEQYLAVQKRYDVLIDENETSSERYRLEDMLDIYKMQLNDLNKLDEAGN